MNIIANNRHVTRQTSVEDFRHLKVALVHYWLVGMRGGEKVLEALCELFPQADIFTLVADHQELSATIRQHRITTSFLQRIGGRRYYQKMLPLMPFALESFDLTGYDLVISSESGPAKGIVSPPDSIHICYCHSPMRYLWDLYPEYRAQSGALTRAIMSVFAPLMRQWDVTTAQRVDHFVANSAFVAKRIEKYYRRQSTVIYPPTNVKSYNITDVIEDYYLCAGQIAKYKRVDLAVEAFTRMNKPLVVAGAGATEHLRRLAGPTIRFVGALSDDELATYFRTCKALIFPGVEDFGLIPIEVMASGRPVIAFGRGGSCETVVHNQTGILFKEQSVEALCASVAEFEAKWDKFDPISIRRHAENFSRDRFKSEIGQLIACVCRCADAQ